MNIVSWEELLQIECPGVMILPTDTVYGLHARRSDDASVTVLKQIKERDNERYFITLISQREHLEQCGVVVSSRHRRMLAKLRPGPYTVLLRDDDGLTYSFRWPDKQELLDVIDRYGPLYSTSANWHGKPTVSSLDELDSEMMSLVGCAVDEGVVHGESSTLIDILR